MFEFDKFFTAMLTTLDSLDNTRGELPGTLRDELGIQFEVTTYHEVSVRTSRNIAFFVVYKDHCYQVVENEFEYEMQEDGSRAIKRKSRLIAMDNISLYDAVLYLAERIRALSDDFDE